MDWENQLQPPHTAEELNGAVIGGVGGMFVKVTTDRENQQQQHPPQTVEELNGAVIGGGGGIVNVPTDRENQQRQQQPPQTAEELNGAVGGGGGGGMFVKVMSDEQMEVLRKQIGVYGVICEQLVHLHKSSQHHLVAGTRLGNLYCDPLITSSGHRINGRQRWTPTPLQLQILERMFDQGNGAPTKQKIKDITFELSQHGEISETNVYNWFQNRRARSKRKQQVVATNYDVESSEVETEADESPNEKKTTPAEDLISSEPAESFDQLSFYATSSNPSPTSSTTDGNFKLWQEVEGKI